MPVNHQRLPAKAGPPGAIGLHVVLQHGGIALTQSIDIDNGTEVIQAMIARDFNRFPYGSLDGFSITHQDVGSVVELVDIPRIEGYSNTDRQSLPERAGGHVHERQAGSRVAFEIGRQRSELEQFALGKETGFGPSGIEQGGSMAF